MTKKEVQKEGDGRAQLGAHRWEKDHSEVGISWARKGKKSARVEATYEGVKSDRLSILLCGFSNVFRVKFRSPTAHTTISSLRDFGPVTNMPSSHCFCKTGIKILLYTVFAIRTKEGHQFKVPSG